MKRFDLFLKRRQELWDRFYPGLKLKYKKINKSKFPNNLWWEYGKKKSEVVKIKTEKETIMGIKILEFTFERFLVDERGEWILDQL